MTNDGPRDAAAGGLSRLSEVLLLCVEGSKKTQMHSAGVQQQLLRSGCATIRQSRHLLWELSVRSSRIWARPSRIVARHCSLPCPTRQLSSRAFRLQASGWCAIGGLVDHHVPSFALFVLARLKHIRGERSVPENKSSSNGMHVLF